MPVLATNKRAHFDYELLDTFEAGLQLTGPEVKSVKDGAISLKGGFVTVKDNELWLLNATITRYRPAASAQTNYDPTRSRKILLHRKQIATLIGKSQEQGLTIVPLQVYTKNRLVKIEIATARGKKKRDKRECIKKREVDRRIRRSMKR